MKGSLTEGPIPRQLMGLGGPMVVGVLAIMLLNAIDTWFVAQLGATELAAISFTFPVVSLIGSLMLGLGTGATSVLSRAIGAGEHERVRRLTTDALGLAMAIVALVSALGLATIDPVFSAMGATEETLPLIHDYMGVWYLGVTVLVVPMVGNSAIRASGDTRTPAAIMMFAALINGLVDPLLIFGLGPFPAMGVKGAAIATVFARGVSMLCVMGVLTLRERMLTAERPQLGFMLASWRDILRVGLPAAGTNIIGPVSIMIITRVVADYGPEAVAAFGAGGRVHMLAMVVPIALSIGLAPFMGQNWGAGRRDRVAAAQTLAERLSLLWGVVAWALLAAFAAPIAAAFAEAPGVVEPLTQLLRVVPLGIGGLAMSFMVSATLNAIDRPFSAAALTATRALVLVLPLCLIGSALYGLMGVFVGVVAADLIGAGLARWMSRGLRRPTA